MHGSPTTSSLYRWEPVLTAAWIMVDQGEHLSVKIGEAFVGWIHRVPITSFLPAAPLCRFEVCKKYRTSKSLGSDPETDKLPTQGRITGECPGLSCSPSIGVKEGRDT